MGADGVLTLFSYLDRVTWHYLDENSGRVMSYHGSLLRAEGCARVPTKPS